MSEDDDQQHAQSIKVAVRARPLNSREKAAGDSTVVRVGHGGAVFVEVGGYGGQEKCFTFDYGYGQDADQQRVHQDLGEQLLTNAVGGYNSCLFAYGQTGAGKSWSVNGDPTSEEDRGLLPRICEGLFSRLGSDESLEEFRVVCTYLEIYNERMRDLLCTAGSSLEVRKHPTQGIYVPGLSEGLVRTYTDVERLLEAGNATRMVSATAMNDSSSRSHAVFTLNVTQMLGDTRQRRAQLHIVDLAGSERQKKTEAQGARLKEGAAINQSLTVLGQVIFALADQQKKKIHVPFRNSKLTFLLSDSLSGNSRTVMIAAVSPAASNADETLNTLRFAQSVKKVKTQVYKNEAVNQDPQVLIQQLRQQIEELKAQHAQELAAASLPRELNGNETGEACDLSDWVPARKQSASPGPFLQSTTTFLNPVDQGDEDSEADDISPLDEQQRQFSQFLDLIQRSTAMGGSKEDQEGVRDLVERWYRLRENVEQANYVMALSMERGYLPTQSGQEKWVATITWKVSDEVGKSGQLEGVLKATLVGDASGSAAVLCTVGEDDINEIVIKLEDQFDVLTEQSARAHHHFKTIELATAALEAAEDPEAPKRPGAPAEQEAVRPVEAAAAAEEKGKEKEKEADSSSLAEENARLRNEVEELRKRLATAPPEPSGRIEEPAVSLSYASCASPEAEGGESEPRRVSQQPVFQVGGASSTTAAARRAGGYPRLQVDKESSSNVRAASAGSLTGARASGRVASNTRNLGRGAGRGVDPNRLMPRASGVSGPGSAAASGRGRGVVSPSGSHRDVQRGLHASDVAAATERRTGHSDAAAATAGRPRTPADGAKDDVSSRHGGAAEARQRWPAAEELLDTE